MIETGSANSAADFTSHGVHVFSDLSSVDDLILAAGALSRLLGSHEPLDSGEAHVVIEILANLDVTELETFLNSSDKLCKIWNSQRDLFVGPTRTLPLEESVYKPWTTDRSHPLAGSKGRSWGDPAVHMMEVLADFGLTPDPDESLPPDHLAVLLEFLAFLLENRAREEAVAFCSDHLDWLPEVRAKARDLEIEGILHGLVRAVETLLDRVTASE
jgi:TorA maturation chaperone TorD